MIYVCTQYQKYMVGRYYAGFLVNIFPILCRKYIYVTLFSCWFFRSNEFDSSRNLKILEIRFNLALQFDITSYKSHYNDALLIFMTLILLSFYVIGLKAKFYKQMKTIGSRFFSHAMVGIHNDKSFYLHYIWSVKSRNT